MFINILDASAKFVYNCHRSRGIFLIQEKEAICEGLFFCAYQGGSKNSDEA